MIRSLKALLFLYVVIALASCVPVPMSYYQPSANYGKIIETTCGYNSGPGLWDKLYINVNRISVYVEAKKDGEHVNIYFKLNVPGRYYTVEWGNGPFIITNDSNLEEIFATYDSFSNEITDISATTDIGYEFYIKVNLKNSKNFLLNSPQLSIDGIKHAIPEIRFEKIFSLVVFSLYC